MSSGENEKLERIRREYQLKGEVHGENTHWLLIKLIESNAEIARLRSALLIYADSMNWDHGGFNTEEAMIIFCDPSMRHQAGYAIAKAALAPKPLKDTDIKFGGYCPDHTRYDPECIVCLLHSKSKPLTEKPRDIVERYIPNDEFVGNGFIHFERMDEDHIWMNLAGRSFDLRMNGKKIEIIPQEPNDLKKYEKLEEPK